MKASTFVAKLQELGIDPSYSRPSVSDDNPYAESLFRTCKYRPDYPGVFVSLEEARAWALRFERWYNHAHKHRNLKFVSPAERHCGADRRSSLRAWPFTSKPVRNTQRAGHAILVTGRYPIRSAEPSGARQSRARSCLGT